MDRFLDFSRVGNLDFSVKYSYLKTIVVQTKHNRGWLVEMAILNSASIKALNDWHIQFSVYRDLCRAISLLSLPFAGFCNSQEAGKIYWSIET